MFSTSSTVGLMCIDALNDSGTPNVNSHGGKLAVEGLIADNNSSTPITIAGGVITLWMNIEDDKSSTIPIFNNASATELDIVVEDNNSITPSTKFPVATLDEINLDDSNDVSIPNVTSPSKSVWINWERD